MRLDRTRIAIIERKQPEILDASLLVFRKFFLPVMGLTLLLAIPFSILNHWLVGWTAADLIEMSSRWRYMWIVSVLIYIEAPLVSVLATSYIGRVMFYEDPTVLELLRDVAKLSHRLLWVHGVQRGVLTVLVLWMLTTPSEEVTGVEVFLPFLCVLVFFIRSLRPYINEILLLERSPLKAKKGDISAGLRSQRLHNPHSGDLFGRGIAMVLVTFCLGLAIIGVFWFVVATITNVWTWGALMTFVGMPFAIWTLVAYVSVFRFLSYLDLRIRLEGWEVELKIRAEANRLNERLRLGSEG